MKTCPNCGAALNDNVKFCGNCGTMQAEESIVQSAQQEQSNTEQSYAEQSNNAQNNEEQSNAAQGNPVQNSSNGVQQQNSGTSGFAITALVLGIVTWILGWFTFAIPGILGIVFGAIAMSQCKKTGKSGYGMAVAGFVLSIIMVIICFIWLILVAIAAVSYVNSFGLFF